jgi:hypothetical protein
MQGEVIYYIERLSDKKRWTQTFATREEAERKMGFMVQHGMWKEGEQEVDFVRVPY